MAATVRITMLVLFAATSASMGAPIVELPKNGVDPLGDPLPDGAIIRFGTCRLRHGQPVYAGVFSPDSKRLATAGQDSRVRIWNADDGRELATVAPTPPVTFSLLSFSPDGTMLAVSNRSNAVGVCEAASGKMIWQENNQSVFGLGWSSDGKRVAAARTDGVVRILDARSGKLEVECIRQTTQLSAVAFANNDKEILAVCLDYTVKKLDAATGKLLGAIPFPKQIQRGLSLIQPRLTFSPDGTHLAVCDSSNGLWMWPVEGEPKRLMSKDVVVGSVSLSISKDNRFVATGNSEGSASVWGVESGRVLRSIYSSRYQPTVALSPDARKLAAFSVSDRTVRLWDVSENRPLGPEAVSGDLIQGIFLDGGKTVATTTNQGFLLTWDVATGKIRDRYDNSQTVTSFITLGSTDDKTVRAVDSFQRSVIWEPGVRGETKSRSTPAIPLSYPNYHAPNGEWVVLRTQTNEISIRESETGKDLKTLRADNRNVGWSSFQMTADMRWLLAVDGNRIMWVWEVADGRLHSSFGNIHQTQPTNLSPDGRLVLAWEATTLALWEVASARERLRIPRSIATIRTFAITRDHRLLLIGDHVGQLFVLDASDGKELKRIAAHNGGIRSITFPRTGNRFLTMSDDGTALVWDADRLTSLLPTVPLPPENVREWMNELSSLNGERASNAIRLLSAYPDATIKLLRTLAKPQVDETAKRIAELIVQLDHSRFKVREEATRELGRYGVEARQALEEAVKRPPSEDARVRMENLLKKIHGGAASIQSLREYRLIEVLERIGSPEARAEVAELAKGPDTPIVREAKAVLERWRK